MHSFERFIAGIAGSFKMLRNEHGFGALTPTNVIGARGKSTEFGGAYKLQVLTVTLGSSSDTVTLVRATDKIGTILGVFAQIVSGTTTNFQTCEASFSGLVITLASYNSSGSASSSAWGPVRLLVIGTDA